MEKNRSLPAKAERKYKKVSGGNKNFQDSGFKIQDSGFRIQDSGFRI
jgi:hypothetical protein